MSELQLLREADEKFRRGDSLTDEELKALAKNYRTAHQAVTRIYHPSYAFFERDLYEKSARLEGYIKARRSTG